MALAFTPNHKMISRKEDKPVKKVVKILQRNINEMSEGKIKNQY